MFDGAQAEISQKECKEHVLARIVPGAGMDQVTGDFRQECEQEQIPSVTDPAPGILETLHDQEGEDRECQSSQHPQQYVERDFPVPDGEQNLPEGWQTIPYERIQVVDQHDRHCQDFEPAPAENLPAAAGDFCRRLFH